MATVDHRPPLGWRAAPAHDSHGRNKGVWLPRLQPGMFASPTAATIDAAQDAQCSQPACLANRICCSSRRRQLLIGLNALLIIIGSVNVELPFSATYCCRSYMVADPWGTLMLAGAVTVTHALCGITGLVLAMHRRRSTPHAVCLSAAYAATAVAACAAAAVYIGIMVSAQHDDHGEVTWHLLPGIYAYDVLMLVSAALGAVTSLAALTCGAHTLHTCVRRLRRRRLRATAGRRAREYRRFSQSSSSLPRSPTAKFERAA